MPSPLGIGFSAAGCGPHGPRTLPPTLPWSLGMPGVITSVIAEANALDHADDDGAAQLGWLMRPRTS